MEHKELLKDCDKKLNLMSILSHFIEAKCEQHGQGDEEGNQIISFSPSEYKEQLLMTTEERLEYMNTKSQTSYSRALKVIPGIVIFQQFEAQGIYDAVLTIINTDKESRFVKVLPVTHSAITVEFKGVNLNTRLAPGMSHTYHIQFSPEQAKDYEIRLKVSTDCGKFFIPIIGIGPRPILDFPNSIQLLPTPVKIPITLSVPIKNVTTATGAFTLTSTSSHFTIKPLRGIIHPLEVLNLSVTFVSSTSGNFSGLILLKYDSRELIRIKTHGSAVNCRICLEDQDIQMPDAFLGLSTMAALRVINESDHLVNFQWMKYRHSQTDFEEKQKLRDLFQVAKDQEIGRCTDLEFFDVSTAEIHEKTCERILEDEMRSLNEESFIFSSKHFALTPMNGKIWPHSCSEVLVTFQPTDFGELNAEAFLEITGSEVRLPLKLSGISKGPEIKLNILTLDLGEVYLCSTQNVEIIASNVGFIPGTLIHQPKSPDFDGDIRIDPTSQELQPNEYKSFNLSFTSPKTGEFVERIDFQIEESAEVISFYIKGTTVCPSLKFNKSSLNLGETGIGFTATAEVALENRSSVPVNFRISVPEDGSDPPVTFREFTSENNLLNPQEYQIHSLPSNPREFLIIPDGGSLMSRESVQIEIKFTPNVPTKDGIVNLQVEVDGSNSIPGVLPVTFRSRFPEFQVKPRGFNLRFCFINFPYTLSFTVKNDSKVEGFCFFPRQVASDGGAVFFSLSRSQWRLKPGESRKATVTVITRSVGRREIELNLVTFGSSEKKSLLIVCEGQGPVVSLTPNLLDFGEVKILEERVMSFKVINDSPIPANFKAFFESKNSGKTSFWSLEEGVTSSGELPALKAVEFTVKLTLRDVGRHSDRLVFEIQHRHPIFVTLNAIGTGSSISIDPEIFPEVDFGTLLTHQDNLKVLTVKNGGIKFQKLTFSNTPDGKNGKVLPQAQGSSIFSLEPISFELGPDGTQEVRIIAKSDNIGTVEELWWLQVAVEGQRKREILGESRFFANFVEPSIKVDKQSLDFWVNHGIDENTSSQKVLDDLEVSNTSGLMVNVRISTVGDFKIVSGMEEPVKMMDFVVSDGENRRISVCLEEKEDKSGLKSRLSEGRLRLEVEGHPSVYNIKCRASVNYPNLVCPKKVEFDGAFGSAVEKNLVLKNKGVIPVNFLLSWIEESVKWEVIEDSRSSSSTESVKGENLEEQCQNSVSNNEIEDKTVEFIDDSPEKSDEGRDSEEFETIMETEDNIAKKSVIESVYLFTIDELIQISTLEGAIPPNSQEIVVLTFNPPQPISLKAKLLCEVLGGPSETIEIQARSDIIKCKVHPKKIDLKNQNIFTSTSTEVKFENLCGVDLHCQIKIEQTMGLCKGILEIVPMSGIVLRRSEVEFKMRYKPLIPGDFREVFTIEIENTTPVDVVVQGHAVLPQIYVDLPRNYKEKNDSVEKEYLAIQTTDFSGKIGEIEESSEEFISEQQRLVDDAWEVIYKNAAVPKIIDLEMAIERFLVTDFIKENFLTSNMHKIKIAGPIPNYYTTEYILNLNHLISDQLSQFSAIIHNYSRHKTQIHLKNADKKNYLSKYGISLKFRDQSLLPGEFCRLDLDILPPRNKIGEVTKKIKRKIYLEVQNGATVPISIIGTITAPFLRLEPAVLNFGDVLIGNCKVMTLNVINDGVVLCKWQVKMFSEVKPADFPFSLSESSGNFSPNDSTAILVYFKPQKCLNFEAEVVFALHLGRNKTVKLVGRGVEQRLKVNVTEFKFPPGIPGISCVEKEFSMKNLSKSPLELSWHHLDQVKVAEDRILRILTHYYGTNEILLPVRKLGGKLHGKIYNFYENLVEQTKLEFFNNFEESEETNDVDEVEVERLVHDYIEKLHEDPDFEKNMEDPLSEIFKEIEESKKTKDEIEEKALYSNNKNVIIFYGAPFTFYQQTSCKTSKIIGLPLLNLNNEFIQLIANGKSNNCRQIREIVDRKYEELIKLAERFIIDGDVTSRTEKSQKSSKIDFEGENEDYLKGNTNYTFPEPIDPRISFKKLPTPEEMEVLDDLSQYEYKIEGIQLLNRILSESEGIPAAKGKSKAKETAKSKVEKKNEVEVQKTFINLDLNLLSGILNDILAKNEYENGFVLQTLSNNFIKSDLSTLSLILDSIPPELITFVNFYNSLEIYELRTTEKRSQIAKEEAEKLAAKLKKMDEMSLEEFEQLSEEDKNLFFEKVHRPRIREGEERRRKFGIPLSLASNLEEIKEEPSEPLPSPTPTEKSKKSAKKSRKSQTIGKKSTSNVEIKEEESTKKGSGKKSSRIDEKTMKSAKKSAVVDSFEIYNKNLDEILQLIDGKATIVHGVSSDPWNRSIYTIITDQIRESLSEKHLASILKSKTPKSTKIDECEPKLYSLHTNTQFLRLLPQKSAILRSAFKIFKFDGKSTKIIDPRMIFQPSETKQFKVTFEPAKTGDFHEEIYFNVIGNDNAIYRLTAEGIGDIPRLDLNPKSVFPKVEKRKMNETHEPIYFLDNETFDFGSLLILQENHKVHQKTVKLNLINPSLVQVNLNLSLPISEGFSLDKSDVSIPPGEKSVLKITSVAPKIGINSGKLVLKIENNPEINEIHLKSTGVKLDIEIGGKSVDFGRILLYRKDCRKINVKNKTAVPFFWKILTLNEINQQISFSETNGSMKPFTDFNFEVHFNAQKIGIVSKELIPLGIFLMESDGQPIFQENLQISAEIYDVAVDFENANPIDLKTVKIGEKTSSIISLKNRGEYEINFAIELDENRLKELNKKLAKNLRENLKIGTATGSLVKNKVVSVNVEFRPSIEMELKELKILKCSLLDSTKNPALVAEIPLTISIVAQYSKFSIEPFPEVFCGTIPIFDRRTTSFFIKNTGIFPIDYQISVEEFKVVEDLPIPDAATQNGGKKKKRKSSDVKLNKKSVNAQKTDKTDVKTDLAGVPVKIGPFLLNKSAGRIEIGKFEEVLIEVHPEIEGKLTNKIFIKTSNCSPKDKKGRSLTLISESCIPTINFTDFSSIFPGSHIIDNFSHFNCSIDEAHSIYSKIGNCLYFEKVIVSHSHRSAMRLYNPGLVPTEVEVNVITDSSAEDDVFVVEPRTEVIPPMSDKIFELTFSPLLIENYTGFLEVAVLPANFNQPKFSVKLSGEGCMPEIVLLEPKILCKHGNGSLDFGKLPIGEKSDRIVEFKNTGKVKAEIVAELCGDVNSVFCLKIGENTEKSANEHEKILETTLNCENSQKIIVLYEPKEIGVHEAFFRIFVKENPYEVTTIDFRAEGFFKPILIKGLPLLESMKNPEPATELKEIKTEIEPKKKPAKGRNKKKSVEDPAPPPVASKNISLTYDLNFGYSSLKEVKSLSFEVQNKCEDRYFRFECEKSADFCFVPSIGHLNFLETKKITVTFRSDVLVELKEVSVLCKIDEVRLFEDFEGNSWDNGQVEENVEEDIDFSEVLNSVEEPNCEVINKDEEIIQFLCSAATDYAVYSCSIDEIRIEGVSMLEKQNFKFDLHNPGNVDLIYCWSIVDPSNYSLYTINQSDEIEDLELSENQKKIDYKEKTHNSLENLNEKSLQSSNSFNILPVLGCIPPNQSEEFVLSFSSAEDVLRGTLNCQIENLNPEFSFLKLPILVKYKLPQYHFEFPEDSPKTAENSCEFAKVLKFEVIGIGKSHVKHFHLINPTEEDYKFHFCEEKPEKSLNCDKSVELSYFHCETPRGIAKIFEKTRIVFSFFARDIGVFESTWKFFIDEFDVEVPFVLIAVVSEPRVSCCPSRVELKPTVKGEEVKGSALLLNDEDITLGFNVKTNSLMVEHGVMLEPMFGVLEGKSQQSLTITLKPKIIGNFNFPVEIGVEKTKETLKLFITGKVCDVIPNLRRIDREPLEIRSNYENIMELGRLVIKKPITVVFELTNMGELAFDYRWELCKEAQVMNCYDLKMSDVEGEVLSGCSIKNSLSIMALKRNDLSDHPITLRIKNGPMFKILLNSSAKRPLIEFSFKKHNFGACYLNSSQSHEISLKISNNDKNPAIIENISGDLRNFSINSEVLSQAISPETAMQLPIYFKPLREGKCEEYLTLLVNSEIEEKIFLRGEGISYKINLVRLQDKLINLGHVPLGKSSKRKFSIINSGKSPVELQINFANASNDENFLMLQRSVEIQPSGLIPLPPNRSLEILVKFKPYQKMSSFEHLIGAQIGSTFIPLSFIQGRCIAADFALNRTILQFGDIILGFSDEQKIILHNSGDIGSKFKWNTRKLPLIFTLEPKEGFSSPGSNTAFKIGFEPQKIGRFSGCAEIDIENHKKIEVQVSGSCKPLPEASEVLEFKTSVRKEEQKELKIDNDLNLSEKIEVTLIGDYFSSEKFINIPPKSSKFFIIKYLPFKMTSGGDFHEGKAILRFETKKSVEIYTLKGQSDAPEPIKRISREIPAKKKHVESFEVENWTNFTKSFSPKIELLTTENEPIFTLTTGDRIDIPARGKRRHETHFQCFNESIVEFKVLFTDPQGEYQYYEVEYKITEGEVQGTINLTSIVRNRVKYCLKIENPLDNKTMHLTAVRCDHPNVFFVGIPQEILQNSSGIIEIEYLPLIAEESTEKVEVFSSELGSFVYELKLKSFPANPEKIFEICTSLGTSKKFRIFVTNFSRNSVEFDIKTDLPFSCEEKSVFIDPGEEIPVEIVYEPFGFQKVERTVTASSETAGEFVFPVVGTTIFPKPQGPFILSSEKPLIIPFKNVFEDAKMFEYSVDPTISFSTESISNLINSKQTANVVVMFKEEESEGEKMKQPITGKLVIYCTDPELCHVNWTYYLKGISS